MKEAFAAALDAPVERAVLLAGGASKEAWAVDSDGRELLIRRAAGGVIHQATLTLEQEFEVLRAAHEAGVKVPEPIAYLGEVEGREAFVMERIKGETIGRRIVKSPPPGLDLQLAEELAKIHAIPPERLPFLEQGDTIARFYDELDSVGEPHPAIELGLHWVKERLPRDASRSSSTATGASAISPSTSRGSSPCSTGSSRTSPTRSRISRGRSCARGGSARTTSTSAGSARSSRTSSGTGS